MPKISIVPHHRESELVELEKKERNHRVRERIRAVRMIGFSSHKKRDICEMMGKGRTTILLWCRRYNESGIGGLHDKENSGGRLALCDQIGRKKIERVLSRPPPDGGLWTGPKLGLWMQSELGYTVGQTQGWRTLRRLGYTIQVPKPANTTASKSRQAAFKKGTSKRFT